MTATRPGGSNVSHSDVLVLGAGPAGLAAAWQAARRGLSVTVLERGLRVGGLAASLDVAGLRVDLGSHRLHPNTDPRVLSGLRHLLGADLQLRTRNGRIRLGGSWVGFPFRAADLVRSLPPGFAARLAAGAVASLRSQAQQETYAAYVRAGLGAAAYDHVYGPFAGKLWGLPGEAIHADQARARITAASPGHLVRRVVRSGRTGKDTEQGRMFYYPRQGFGQISEALTRAARLLGAEVLTRREVLRLDAGPDDVVAHLADGATVTGRWCLSTLPLPVLARLAGRPLAPQDTLSLRAMALVYLVHTDGRSQRDEQLRWTPYDAHYLPDPTSPVTRVSEPRNYRDNPAEPSNRTVLCAEIPCAVGDPVWTAPDQELVRLARRALADHGLPPVDLVDSVVLRLPAVYPVYELDYRRRLAVGQAAVAGLPRVVSFGRLGLFAHDNSHHAMLEGLEAVDCLLPDGSFDEDAWAAALARYAGHRVED